MQIKLASTNHDRFYSKITASRLSVHLKQMLDIFATRLYIKQQCSTYP